MSVKAGDIVIELNLDNDGFTARVKDSGRVLRSLQGDFQRTATSVKKMEEQTMSMSRRFRDLVLTMGNLRFVAMDINDIFLKLPVAILKAAGEMERLEKTMTGLSTKFTDVAKAAEGAANFKFVTDMAKRAPFEISAIADAFIKFKTGGLDPTNGSLQALADSVAKFGGNGESMKRASVAIQQMLGKGVVSMEELRQQLGEAVPTAMRDMADGMGLSMAQLAAKIKTGTVEAASAIEKMLLRMKVNNAGAAEAMMDTWVGSMARLQTEWSLTAKFISENSGFGDAAKGALDAISAGLSSDDFKRFAISFGGTLKDAVEAFVSFSRVVIENRDAIKALIEVYALYKVGTALVYPAMKAIEKGMLEKRAAVMAGVQATRDSIVADREATVTEASNALYRVEKRQQELAAKLAADREELASVRARNAAIIAEDVRMQAQLAALRMAERTTGVNNIGAQQSTLRYMDELSRKNGELKAREMELARSVSDTAVAHAGATNAVSQKTAALAAATSGSMAASRASVLLGSAMKGMGVAFSALGGPIGLLTIALMVGIEVWNHYGRAAEEAAARAKRARDSLSTEEDGIAARTELAKAKADLAAQQRVNAQPVPNATGSDKKAFEAMSAKRAEDLAAAQRRVMQAEEVLANTEQSLRETRSREANQAAERRTNDELRTLQRGAQAEIQGIKEQTAAKIDALDKTSKDFDKRKEAIEKEGVARENAAFLANRKRQVEILKQERKNAEYTLGNQGESDAARNAAGDRLKSLEALIAAKESEYNRDVANAVPGVKTIALDKPAKDSPIQRLIKQLQEDNAGLKVEMDNLGQTFNVADKVAAKMAEIEQKFKDGKFDGHGKDGVKATQSQVDEVKRLEAIKIYREQTVKDSQDFTRRMDSLGPRYQEAIEILADPLGTMPKDKSLKGVDEYLAHIDPSRLIAIAEKAGYDSITALKGAMRGQAAVTDFAPEFQKMAAQTEQLNEAMVDDSREAAKARKIASDEVYRGFSQNMIDMVRDSANGNAEIIKQADAMQVALNANMAARAANTAQKFQSPVEKMAAEWANATRNMEEASVRWSEGTIDAMFTTGKTAQEVWGGLVKSVILDLMKIQAKKAMGGAMSTLMSAASSYFGGSSAGVDTSGYSSAVATAMATKFANGGIMTEYGSVPLRKYAAGGIANSPQMAIYGEGDDNEAFVPLPDGRRIPVALQGGGQGAPSVQVNVINQSGTAVSAQQGQTRFDGKQMVLDVVLTAVHTAGPFRDGMKSALTK